MLSERCPGCGVDLTGGQIPQSHRHMYDNLTHYSRKIPVKDVPGGRDLLWRCPDCAHLWHATDEGDPLHAAAEVRLRALTPA